MKPAETFTMVKVIRQRVQTSHVPRCGDCSVARTDQKTQEERDAYGQRRAEENRAAHIATAQLLNAALGKKPEPTN